MIEINYQLFAEGGEAGEGEGQDAAATIEGKAKNPLADVKYGIQQEEQPAAEVVEEPKKATFAELLKDPEYNAEMQKVVQKRLKGAKETEGKLNALKPVLEILASKYSKEPDDIEGIVNSVSQDTSYYEERAFESGLPVETVMHIDALERELKAKQEVEQRTIAEQRTRAHFERLVTQAEELKKIYPNMDLETELQNPDFLRLTSPGVNIDVRTAYEAVHRQEIQAAQMQFAAQQSAQMLSNAIQSGKRRPAEAGTSAPNNVISDPMQFSKEDRAEIKRRVARGEKIYL